MVAFSAVVHPDAVELDTCFALVATSVLVESSATSALISLFKAMTAAHVVAVARVILSLRRELARLEVLVMAEVMAAALAVKVWACSSNSLVVLEQEEMAVTTSSSYLRHTLKLPLHRFIEVFIASVSVFSEQFWITLAYVEKSELAQQVQAELPLNFTQEATLLAKLVMAVLHSATLVKFEGTGRVDGLQAACILFEHPLRKSEMFFI